MVAGRRVALTAAGIAGLLALLDVRPESPGAATDVRMSQGTGESAAGSTDPTIVTSGDRAGSAPRPAPHAATGSPGATGAPRHFVSNTPDHDLITVPRGDGHRFGELGLGRAAARTPGEAPVEALAPGHLAASPSSRSGAWGWRGTEGGEARSRSRGGATESGLSVARSPLAPDTEAAGPALRVTQTFAYVHGVTAEASTASTGTRGGFEIPTDVETDVDLETDTGTDMEPVPRRSGHATSPSGHGHRGGASPSGPPTRAEARGTR